MRSLKWLVASAALGLAAGCGGDGGVDGAGGGPEEAATAPPYEAVTLDGEPVSLSDLRGEVVLLNVWATWCAPCRREIPELQALHTARRDEGLKVVGVTVDSRTAEAEIRRFIEEFRMTYEIWWDPDQTAVGTFAAAGVPLTVLIDRDGRMVWEHLGAFERGDSTLIAAVDSALAVTPVASPSSSE